MVFLATYRGADRRSPLIVTPNEDGLGIKLLVNGLRRTYLQPDCSKGRGTWQRIISAIPCFTQLVSTDPILLHFIHHYATSPFPPVSHLVFDFISHFLPRLFSPTLSFAPNPSPTQGLFIGHNLQCHTCLYTYITPSSSYSECDCECKTDALDGKKRNSANEKSACLHKFQ